MRTVRRLLLFLALAVHAGLLAPLALGAHPAAVRSPRGMVVAPEAHAAEIGAAVLRDGGNAADAAVAVAFALAVTNPQAGGLGGGGFLLYRESLGEYVALDFREVAPAALRAETFLDEEGRPVSGRSLETGLAVGVPGHVAGLWEIHRRFGSLSWKRLVRPAARLAREGFAVYPHLELSIEQALPRLRADAEAGRLFLRDGRPLRVGERLRQPDLAITLGRIASRGPRAFYEGTVAEAIAASVAARDGVLAVEDLVSYRPSEREPLVGNYRGHAVVSFPPPSSGGVALLQMLGMLERGDLPGGFGASATVHRMAEIERRAFADRSRWLGDPAFVSVPVGRLLAPSYLAGRMASFDPSAATPSAELQPGEIVAEGTDTLHYSVADANGRVAAITLTLNTSFGSGIVAAGTGVVLNNEMDDFALAPGVPNVYGLVGDEANAVAPGKRPLSSMTPTIVERRDGGARPLLVLGSPGGGTIITSVLQVLVNAIDHGMPLQEAVDAPRFHHQWLPDRIDYEPRSLVEDVREALERRGHELHERRQLGNVNAIGTNADGDWLGAADPRRGGRAAAP